jgi:inosine-uridine nucleoside N-ribohydrolase
VTLFAQIAKHHQHVATDTLLHAVKFYADFYSDLYPHVAKIHGCFGHDVLAFIYLTNPEFFSLESGRMRVAVDGLAQGQTMLRRRHVNYPQTGWDAHVPLTHVCMEVDAKAARQVLEDTLMRDWLKA